MGRLHLSRWRPVQIVLYLFLRGLHAFVSILPYGITALLSRILAPVFRISDRRGRRWLAINVGLTRITDDPVVFARRVYESQVRTMIETMILCSRLRRKALPPEIRFHGLEHISRALAENRGAVVAIGHLGNWEVAGLALSRAGYPLNSLAQPVKNPYVSDWVHSIRISTGQRILTRDGALPAMVEVVKSGEILAVQIDLAFVPGNTFVDFFGAPARCVSSPALLSLRYGAPVVPAEVYRDEKGVHHVVFHQPIRSRPFRGRPGALREIMQVLTHQLEGFIRKHPEQWMWTRPRWEGTRLG